jgi:hypothetical protein
MSFSKWHYSPEKESDLLLGERIWNMVAPSLRKLRFLLQFANQIAETSDKEGITRQIIDEAFRHTVSAADIRRFENTTSPKAVGNHEAKSHQRHSAR